MHLPVLSGGVDRTWPIEIDRLLIVACKRVPKREKHMFCDKIYSSIPLMIVAFLFQAAPYGPALAQTGYLNGRGYYILAVAPADLSPQHPVDISLPPYNAICNGTINVANAVDRAVAAGATSIFLPANCLYIPDNDTTPADVQFSGGNWQTTIIQSHNQTTTDVSIGPRGSVSNVSIDGVFCYDAFGPADLSRRCPVHFAANQTDSAWPAGVYPGSGPVINTGNVTFNGITTTDGSGPQGLVVFCASEDCIYLSNTSPDATALRIVTTADTPAQQAFQMTSDGYGLNYKALKQRGTFNFPLAVQSDDLIYTLGAYAYDGANFIESGEADLQAVGTISAGIVPGAFTIRLADSSGTMLNALQVNADAGVVDVDGHQISDFSGNLRSANGVSCPAGTVNVKTMVVVNGIVTGC
jgi:hypothetical protein